MQLQSHMSLISCDFSFFLIHEKHSPFIYYVLCNWSLLEISANWSPVLSPNICPVSLSCESFKRLITNILVVPRASSEQKLLGRPSDVGPVVCRIQPSPGDTWDRWGLILWRLRNVNEKHWAGWNVTCGGNTCLCKCRKWQLPLMNKEFRGKSSLSLPHRCPDAEFPGWGTAHRLCRQKDSPLLDM